MTSSALERKPSAAVKHFVEAARPENIGDLESINTLNEVARISPARPGGSAPHELGDALAEIEGIDGLRQERVEPHVGGLEHVVPAPMSREGDRRNPAAVPTVLQLIDQPEAVLVRHREVADDDVRTHREGFGESVTRVRRGLNGRAEPLEREAQDVEGIRVVVDNEHHDTGEVG